MTRRDHVDAETPGDRLGDLLRRVERRVELAIHVSAPATVVSYDPATQTATVVLGFRSVEDRAIEVPDAPIQLDDVIVAWEQSAGSYDVRPLTTGDTGLVWFTDRALDEWIRKGGAVDPIDGRAHSLADAVFRPGMPRTPITPPPLAGARVIEASTIMLGATAVLHPALAESLHTYLVGLITAATPVAMDGGASMKTTMLAYLSVTPATAFATTKVVAQ